jgi:uncharacterized protein
MAFVVRQGEIFRVTGESTCDLVAFKLENLRERFDQARTKVANGKIFLTKGDSLYSKFNDVMLTITEDQFDGTHDLQKGMCSERVYQDIFRRNYDKFNMSVLGVPFEKFPKHGCWENLSSSLKSWGILPEDIPSPFNIFQHMKIDGKTGRMEFTDKVPPPGTYVDLEAKMNCLVAVSACPWFGKGKPLEISIYVP